MLFQKIKIQPTPFHLIFWEQITQQASGKSQKNVNKEISYGWAEKIKKNPYEGGKIPEINLNKKLNIHKIKHGLLIYKIHKKKE